MGYFGYGYYGEGVEAIPPPGVFPDFRAALVAYWLSTQGLIRISAFPYADVGPYWVEEEASFCTLSQLSTRLYGRGSRKRAYLEETFYQFAIYHEDSDRAIELGQQMTDLLDPIQDHPLAFANGKQRAWFRTGERLLKTPETSRSRTGAARTVWQQTHIYRARILRYRSS